MSGGAATRVMNPIALLEALDIRSKIAEAGPGIAAKMGDDAVVQSKFAVCGGCLWYILLTHEEMLKKIYWAVSKLNFDLLADAVGGNMLSGDNGRLCHRILHVWRHNDPGKIFFLRFCSTEVCDRVLNALAAQNVNGLLELANKVDINGSLRGQVWENRVHSMFCGEKEITCDVRELNMVTAGGAGPAAATFTVTIPAMSESFVFNKIDDVACKAGVYYRPKSSNFEIVDAFFVFRDGDNLVAVLVQATVSTSHSVKLAGLKSVLKSIENGVGKVDRKVLVFLTPKAAFDRFGPHRQEITIAGGAKAAFANQDIVVQQVWSVREWGGETVW
eukprot:m.155615 g.155615  ORF g.155615 m.155615 type:complete len:331 (-) comp11721_c0_seq24:160-1152(-)